MSALDAVDMIIRDGRERIEQARRDAELALLDDVRAGRPILIWGVKYVPAEPSP